MMSWSAPEPDRLSHIATELFYGWGYTFYNDANRLRFDDLLVREKACWLLSQCRALIEAQLSAYRKTRLPPPTRDKPLPDAEAVANAGVIAGLSSELSKLEGLIRIQPVPENDRMTRRFREEAPSLLRLRDFDVQLIGLAKLLRETLDNKDWAWLLAQAAVVSQALREIADVLRQRQEMLMV